MIIKHLKLENFRNYTAQTVNFSNGINVINGENAQGKTNLLEAIYFCSIGKSLKTTKENELIRFGQTQAKISVNYEKNCGDKNINIYFTKSQKKAVQINSLFIHRLGDLLGELCCIFFSPDELKLVKETPQDRRRFMDIDISQFSKPYFDNLLKYNKVLSQRNKLLKSSPDISVVKDTVFIWNKQLSSLGAKIIKDRMEFLDLLQPFASDIQKELTNNKEELKLQYYSEDFENFDTIEQELFNKLDNSFEKDYRLGFTSIGPHRDDIKLLVNDTDIRSYGSQGQQRTVALCLKLAETEVFKFLIGEYPILLLDDVMSELDASRRNNLLKFISKFQTIITSTEEIQSKNLKINNLTIKGGKVI